MYTCTQVLVTQLIINQNPLLILSSAAPDQIPRLHCLPLFVELIWPPGKRPVTCRQSLLSAAKNKATINLRWPALHLARSKLPFFERYHGPDA